jgi:thiol-disulfide isomerase/thioredoxin
LKNIISTLAAVLLSFAAMAQKDSSAATLPCYLTVPVFNITAVPDSNVYASTTLQKNKPVVIIMFSPDCEHCQNETKELLAWRKEIKDLQIIMVSTAPYIKVNEFYQDYNIAALPNVKMGCDIEYKLALVFRAATYPAVYVYDSKGVLSKAYIGGAAIPDIIKAADN